MLFCQDDHMLLSSQRGKPERFLIIYILKLNQWKNTKEVIDWFASIDEKFLYKFDQFDSTEFYPSIKEPVGKSFKIFRRVHWHTNQRQGYYQ